MKTKLLLCYLFVGILSLSAAWVPYASHSESAHGATALLVVEKDDTWTGDGVIVRVIFSGTPPSEEGWVFRGTGFECPAFGNPSVVRQLGDPMHVGPTQVVSYIWETNVNRYTGGGAYTTIGTWSFTGTPTTYKVTFAIPANNTDHIIRYEFKQGGTVVGSFTTGPGDGAQEYTLTGLSSDAPVTAWEVTSNLQQNPDGTWSFGPSDYVRQVNGGTTPVPTNGPSNTPGTTTSPTAPTTNPTGNNTPAPTTGGGGSSSGGPTQSVWQSPSGTTPTGGSTQGVTDSLYKEGVDKTVAGLNGVKDAIVTASQNQATRDGVRNGKLDTIATKLDAIKTAVENSDGATVSQTSVDSKVTTFGGSAKNSQAMSSANSAGDSARAQGDSVLSQFGGAPDMSGNVAPVAGDDYVDLDIGVGSQTVRMYFNPFEHHPLVSAGAVLIKRLVAWGLVVGFFVWCISRIREMCFQPFATAPFGDTLAKSINSISVLGTTSQGAGYLVKLALYALILTTLLTMPLAVMASVTAGLPWSALVSTFHAGPLGSMTSGLQTAVSLANYVIPWQLLVAAPLYYFVVESVLFPSQLFWTFFIKFLPS